MKEMIFKMSEDKVNNPPASLAVNYMGGLDSFI